jgi:hypothetical protein
MVEKALQIGLHSELHRIFLGVGKNNPYTEPGLGIATASLLITVFING